ncbi:MAG: phosphatidylinositol kinase, partial [Chloroflexota bacterium]|nr:phosphatidylinositol kinase [Chloroflexota bacterium]
MPAWLEVPSWPNDSLLESGEAVTCDLTPLGSNYTFIVCLQGENGEQIKAIYKPRKGEVPLWDFPHGTLHLRECASYLLAEALGWH